LPRLAPRSIGNITTSLVTTVNPSRAKISQSPLRVEGDFSFTKLVGQKLDKTEYFVQFEPKGAYPEDAPARLIPELLDRLAALGDLAKQVNLALGGNGYRAGEIQKILEGLRGHHDSQGGDW